MSRKKKKASFNPLRKTLKKRVTGKVKFNYDYNQLYKKSSEQPIEMMDVLITMQSDVIDDPYGLGVDNARLVYREHFIEIMVLMNIVLLKITQSKSLAGHLDGRQKRLVHGVSIGTSDPNHFVYRYAIIFVIKETKDIDLLKYSTFRAIIDLVLAVRDSKLIIADNEYNKRREINNYWGSVIGSIK